MFAQLDLPRCELCGRDAAMRVCGRFSGEERIFRVCRGCCDELHRIRRNWIVAPILDCCEDCLSPEEWELLADRGIYVGRLRSSSDEDAAEFDVELANDD